MRKITVDEKFNNKKLGTFLQGKFNGLSSSTFYKALRKKDILVNDTRVKENVVLHTNDIITVYITDDFLFNKLNFDIVYEDDNIIIVNKPSGIEVVSQNNVNETLTTLLQSKKNDINIMPCHRLDRNTSGLVLFAKNGEALDILTNKFKNHEIEKYYKCLVFGKPSKSSSTEEAYLFKDNKKSKVYIYDEPKKGTVKIITSYKVLSTNKDTNTSILEVTLHTGRTNQIRAHLAHLGHPIIGDRKIW